MKKKELYRRQVFIKRNNIDFSVISVITDFTLDYADEFYSFFKTLNPTSVGLNVEEIENYNIKSSLFNSEKILIRYKNFINRTGSSTGGHILWYMLNLETWLQKH